MIRRFRLFAVLWAACCALGFASGAAQATWPPDAQAAPVPSLAPMLETIDGAVVNLSVASPVPSAASPWARQPFFRRYFEAPPQRRRGARGSGVIVDAARGYVITNHHIIQGGGEITVTTQDGRVFATELTGSDANSDIAVLKIAAAELPAMPLAEIPLGRSANLRVGDFVVAIGNPYGLGQTVTSGIVSALGRSGLGIEDYEDFIQTDAAINPGNSGGALVDLRGRLIGINTAIFSRHGGSVGIGFAIPIDMARRVMNQLIEHGNIRRGLLGVTMQDLTPALAEASGARDARGAVVTRVMPGSAADEAGLAVNDIIIGVNDTAVADGADLRNAIGLLRTGAQARVRFYRDGEPRTVAARIKSAAPAAPPAGNLLDRLQGARLRATTSPAAPGLEVLAVLPASPAARAGLMPKDRILSANRRTVRSLDELRRIAATADSLLSLKILRGQRALLLVIR